MNYGKHISDADIETICRMYNSGEQVCRIALSLHVARYRVTNLIEALIESGKLQRRPLTKGQHMWKREEEETIFELKRRGYTWSEISSCVGIPKGACKAHWYNIHHMKDGPWPEPEPEEPETLDKWQARETVKKACELYNRGCSTEQIIVSCANVVGVEVETMRRELPKLLKSIAIARKR